MNNPIETVANGANKISSQHIEEFACAFAKHTNLPPDKCVMVIRQSFDSKGMVQEIWFREKGDNEILAEPPKEEE